MILPNVHNELITTIKYAHCLNEDELKLHNGQLQFSFCQLQNISDFFALFRNFLSDSLVILDSLTPCNSFCLKI